MPKKIDPELKARAVRLVSEHRGEYPTVTAASQAAAKQLGVGKESVRRWVIQAEIDVGARDGTTTEESDEIRRLKAENRRLREDVAILKAAATFFASGNSTPATVDDGLHRPDARAGVCGRVDLSGAAGAGLPGRRTDLPGLEGRPGRRPDRHRRSGRRCGPRAGLGARSAVRSDADDARRAVWASQDDRAHPPEPAAEGFGRLGGPGDAHARVVGGPS